MLKWIRNILCKDFISEFDNLLSEARDTHQQGSYTDAEWARYGELVKINLLVKKYF